MSQVNAEVIFSEMFMNCPVTGLSGEALQESSSVFAISGYWTFTY